MLSDALRKLAAEGSSKPLTKARILNIGLANARIYELEKLCGLEPGRPVFNIHRANQRIDHLESVLKQAGIALPGAAPTTPAPVTATAPAPTAAPVASQPANVRPLIEYLKLSDADRRGFVAAGLKLNYSDFSRLSNAGKADYCRNGGQIHSDQSSGAFRCTAQEGFRK
jgi:hypothetical protein